MMASMYGYINLVNALIQDGAYVNATASYYHNEYGDNVYGVTALMVAALTGFSDICKSLIDNGAYINQAAYARYYGVYINNNQATYRGDYKYTPLMFAVVENKSDVVTLLIKEKASDVGFDQLEESDIEGIDKNIKNMLSKAGIDIDTTGNNIGENVRRDYELVGLIDNKYPITMQITIDKDGNASGTYYYDKYKKDIFINGSINYNELILKENVDGEITGEFIGVFDSDNVVYKGNWINASTRDSMPFILTQNYDQ